MVSTREGAQEGVTTELLAATWKVIREDPAKGLGIVYLWFTAVGFARLFGSGIAFGINAIDLASPADFLTAGVRDPFAVLLAFLSGIGLLRIWRKGLTSSAWRRCLAPTAGVLLLIAILASSWYRHAVIAGSGYLSRWGPVGMTVTTDAKESAGPPSSGLKLVLSTSGFLVFFRSTDKHVVLIKRDSITRMDSDVPVQPAQ